MIQQILALIIILFFLPRLFWQKRKKQIAAGELVFWLVFWFFAALAIVFIKQIDRFVARMGFSGTGIDVIIYLAVAILFYLIFRVRIKLEKIDKDITKIVREIALNNRK